MLGGRRNLDMERMTYVGDDDQIKTNSYERHGALRAMF